MDTNRTKQTIGGVLLILSILVTVWIGLPVDATAAGGQAARNAVVSPEATGSESGISRGESKEDPSAAERSLLAVPRSRALNGDDADFDALLETLVKITLEASQAARGGETSRVQELDADGREVLDYILLHVEDPEDQALHKLTGLPTQTTTELAAARRMLCVGILKQGLSNRHRGFELGGSRRQADQIVANALDCIPQDEVIARELSSVLTDAPFLGVAHESAVLDLCVLAAEEPDLISLVTGLLETLWHNLRAEGARTSEDLVHLALLFRGDSNPAKRLVALRYLLVVDDGRYRELALREVLESRDDDLVEQLTMTVAAKLEPKEATVTLEKMSLVSTSSLMPAFLTLGGRDASVLVAAYEQKLADGTRADFRAELVTGAGFQGGGEGLAVARLAFGNDPDPGVRTRAMFILSAHGDPSEAEKVLTAAIADPAFHGRPEQLGHIVLALENLAARADSNTVDRIGRSLQSAGRLLPGDRARLKLILDRSLPKSEVFPGVGKTPGK